MKIQEKSGGGSLTINLATFFQKGLKVDVCSSCGLKSDLPISRSCEWDLIWNGTFVDIIQLRWNTRVCFLFLRRKNEVGSRGSAGGREMAELEALCTCKPRELKTPGRPSLHLPGAELCGLQHF